MMRRMRPLTAAAPEDHLALESQFGHDFRKRCGVGEIGVDCALGEWLGVSVIGGVKRSAPSEHGQSTMRL
jgi:hypothetical protein